MRRLLHLACQLDRDLITNRASVSNDCLTGCDGVARSPSLGAALPENGMIFRPPSENRAASTRVQNRGVERLPLGCRGAGFACIRNMGAPDLPRLRRNVRRAGESRTLCEKVYFAVFKKGLFYKSRFAYGISLLR